MSRFEYYRPASPGSFSMFPPVIKYLLVINIGVFILQFLLSGVQIGSINTAEFGGSGQIIPLSADYYFSKYFMLHSNGDGVDLVRTASGGAFRVPYYPDGGWSPFFWVWQVFTYQFLHGGFFHLFFNMFALWMFGMELETLWGSRRFLTYYLLSGVGAAIVQILIATVPTLGASGAVYGILLAFGMTFPNRQIFMFPLFIPIKAKYFVMIFAGIELFSGLRGSDGIAHFAHLGGAATGFLLLKYGEELGIYKFFEKIYGSLTSNVGSSASGSFSSGSSYSTPSSGGAKVHKMFTRQEEKIPTTEPVRKQTQNFSVAGEEITQQRIDAILDKISESGYQNLTEKEKNILFELSKRL